MKQKNTTNSTYFFIIANKISKKIKKNKKIKPIFVKLSKFGFFYNVF